MVAHPGHRITQYDQAALFGSVYVKTMTMDKAATGLESPVLWPFNSNKIPDEEYIASLVTDEPQPSTAGTMSSGTDPIAVVSEPAATTKKTTSASARKSMVGLLLFICVILYLYIDPCTG